MYIFLVRAFNQGICRYNSEDTLDSIYIHSLSIRVHDMYENEFLIRSIWLRETKICIILSRKTTKYFFCLEWSPSASHLLVKKILWSKLHFFSRYSNSSSHLSLTLNQKLQFSHHLKNSIFCLIPARMFC